MSNRPVEILYSRVLNVLYEVPKYIYINPGKAFCLAMAFQSVRFFSQGNPIPNPNHHHVAQLKFDKKTTIEFGPDTKYKLYSIVKKPDEKETNLRKETP